MGNICVCGNVVKLQYQPNQGKTLFFLAIAVSNGILRAESFWDKTSQDLI